MNGKAQPGYASQNVMSSLVVIYVQFPCMMSDCYFIIKVSDEKETRIVRRQFFHLRAKDPTFIPRNVVSPPPPPSKRQTSTEDSPVRRLPKTLLFVLTHYKTTRAVTSTPKGVSCSRLKVGYS